MTTLNQLIETGLALEEKATPELIERIMSRSKINKNTGCILRQTFADSKGYTRIMVQKKQYLAHRFVYEIAVGKIPNGMVLDHLCRNRSCINPKHLEPVSPRENVHRGMHPNIILMKKKKCMRGHAVVGNNVLTRPGGKIFCRECTYNRNNKWRKAKRKSLKKPTALFPNQTEEKME